MAYTTCTVPAGGKISIQNGKLERAPDQPIVPFIRGVTVRVPTSGRPVCVCWTPRWQRPTAAKRKFPGWKYSAGEDSFKKFNNWLPDDTVDAFKEFLVGIKGPLTTPVGGGHPLVERRLAPDARSLRLLASGAMVHRGPVARKTSGKGEHGDLSGKYRGYLCRH